MFEEYLYEDIGELITSNIDFEEKTKRRKGDVHKQNLKAKINQKYNLDK